MGVDAPLLVVAIGSAVLIVSVSIATVVLCLRALRQGAEFEGELKAPSVTFKIRTTPCEHAAAAADTELPLND
jgi:hypothetical protein